MKIHLALFLALITAAAQGDPRTSMDYSITTDITDAGGQRGASGIYTNDSSIGGVVGISTAPSHAVIAKIGYIGQLYDITAGLALSAASLTVNETATDQIKRRSPTISDINPIGAPMIGAHDANAIPSNAEILPRY